MSRQQKSIRSKRKIRLILLVTFVVEFILTFDLWTSVDRDFPLINALPGLEFEYGIVIRSMLFAALLFSLLWTCLVEKWRTLAFFAFFAVAFLLVLEDISRLQPWLFVQVAILGAVSTNASGRGGSALARAMIFIILAGTYCWSGLQKFNLAFLTELAPWFIESFGFEAVGPTAAESILTKAGSIPSRFLPFLVLPVAECLLGLGLLFSRTRFVSIILAIAFHLLVIAALGPFGRSYNEIIIPWNLAFILILLVLSKHSTDENILGIREKLTVGKGLVISLFLILPAFNFLKLWDHNLSASLYSGDRPSGSYFYFKNMESKSGESFGSSGVDRLDEHGDYLGTEVPFDQWIMTDLNVPFYSEQRTIKQLGIALCKKSPFKEGSGVIMTVRERINSKPSIYTCYCDDLLNEACDLP